MLPPRVHIGLVSASFDDLRRALTAAPHLFRHAAARRHSTPLCRQRLISFEAPSRQYHYHAGTPHHFQCRASGTPIHISHFAFSLRINERRRFLHRHSRHFKTRRVLLLSLLTSGGRTVTKSESHGVDGSSERQRHALSPFDFSPPLMT